MTIVSSQVIIKKYVLAKLREIMSADTTVASFAKQIYLGMPIESLGQLDDSQYPFINIIPSGSDSEDNDAAPDGVEVIQSVDVQYGLIQPSGELFLSGAFTAYDMESYIKTSLDTSVSRRLTTTTAGVSPNPMWASVETFDFGSTDLIIFEPEGNINIWETKILIRHPEDRTPSGRVSTIWFDDGN